MIRVDRLHQLADALQTNTLPEGVSGFSMSTWHCATGACIAGWTLAMWPSTAFSSVPERAAHVLGLDKERAQELFLPTNYLRSRLDDLDKVTRQDAAKVVRHLAQTGLVDWTIAQ